MTWLIYVIGTILGVIVLDQGTKWLIVRYLYEGQKVLIPHVFRFTYVENRGMAFGLLSEHRWVFLILATVGIAAVFFYLAKYVNTHMGRVSLALVVGGGIGNMIDRLSLGYVIDFLDFCAFPNLWMWVFNVADAAVCVGAALFLLDLILTLIREKKKKDTPAEKEANNG